MWPPALPPPPHPPTHLAQPFGGQGQRHGVRDDDDGDALDRHVRGLAHDDAQQVARQLEDGEEEAVHDEELVGGDRGVQGGTAFAQQLFDGQDLQVRGGGVVFCPTPLFFRSRPAPCRPAQTHTRTHNHQTHPLVFGGERGHHAGLGLGQGHARVRGAQRTTVVAAIAAHAHHDTTRDELLNDADLSAAQGEGGGGEGEWGPCGARNKGSVTGVAAPPPPAPHLALRLDARKYAGVVEQGRGPPRVLQHLEGRSSDGEFQGTRLQVRTVLRRGGFASQKIVCVRMRRTPVLPAPHAQRHSPWPTNRRSTQGPAQTRRTPSFQPTSRPPPCC